MRCLLWPDSRYILKFAENGHWIHNQFFDWTCTLDTYSIVLTLDTGDIHRSVEDGAWVFYMI